MPMKIWIGYGFDTSCQYQVGVDSSQFGLIEYSLEVSGLIHYPSFQNITLITHVNIKLKILIVKVYPT